MKGGRKYNMKGISNSYNSKGQNVIENDLCPLQRLYIYIIIIILPTFFLPFLHVPCASPSVVVQLMTNRWPLAHHTVTTTTTPRRLLPPGLTHFRLVSRQFQPEKDDTRLSQSSRFDSEQKTQDITSDTTCKIETKLICFEPSSAFRRCPPRQLNKEASLVGSPYWGWVPQPP